MIDAAARDTWRELNSQLRPFVARRLRSAADVDDVMQDVFLRMHRGLEILEDEQRFGPWIYQVTRNAIVDHLRMVARHPVESKGRDALSLELPDAPDDEDEGFGIQAEVASYMPLFVSRLRSPYREALTLTELEGMSQKEAAQVVGVSLSGMKSRVQRGRDLLRNALLDCCHIALDVRGAVVACEPRVDGCVPDGCCK